MNLESIQTPADLVRVNEEVKAYAAEIEAMDTDKILEAIMTLSYEEMDNLVYALLQHQVDFHKLIVEKQPEGIDHEKMIGNLSKLRTIRDLYGEV